MIDWMLLGLALVAVAIAALPLHIAVRLLGGETTLIRTILVNLAVGLASALLAMALEAWVGAVTLLVTIALYKVFFRIGWVKALLVWLLSFVVAGVLLFLALFLFGSTAVLGVLA